MLTCVQAHSKISVGQGLHVRGRPSGLVDVHSTSCWRRNVIPSLEVVGVIGIEGASRQLIEFGIVQQMRLSCPSVLSLFQTDVLCRFVRILGIDDGTFVGL